MVRGWCADGDCDDGGEGIVMVTGGDEMVLVMAIVTDGDWYGDGAVGRRGL